MFGKADEPVSFQESQGQMETEAFVVIQFAVTGEFGAVLFLRPGFTGGQKLSCHSPPPVFLPDENAFQVAHRTAVRALHIVMAQLALGESDGLPLPIRQEDCNLDVRN